ncbi:ribonuclease, Rne/Rng family [Desulfocapsa sulfexigens DSM 10523]|uniref:Ribonuclease G n=1 Tax=Desulfocapsa sulfexigens (strain DSM 10523 / SB164P1) TaxID=1167006 RepID=M1PJW3_DESSD|nr:Rne/Rng family ribonuclease [Desulfocapsa sulfexigens]AGF76806.1 ribonuclease, Rne/Rng family [Desulfocapsa sulfexigens DSM 10523]
MVDKKAEPKKKAVQEKTVKKASTGAWWKSTKKKETVPDVPDVTAGVVETAEPAKKTAPKARKKTTAVKSAAKPRAPRKKPVPRKKPTAEVAEKAKAEVKQPDVLVEADQLPAGSQMTDGSDPVKVDTSEEAKPKTKPSRPRGGRSNQQAKGPGKGKQPEPAVEKPVSMEKPPLLKLLVNAEEPEECRLALLADGRLESIHVSTLSSKQTKNNIYKAKIVAIESNLQAAFVDYGTDKNGFLPFNEIHPEYYKQEISEENKRYIEQHQWKKLRVTDVLERGQEVLVQVVKEEVGNKGANMTTYLSIPGRGVVLMPGSDSSGISRKISGEERRSQLREIMGSLNIPEGVGWIVRTASMDVTKTALTKDVRSLSRLWNEIKLKGQAMEGVGLVYQDHDCVLRFLREHFDPEIKEILVDDLAALEKVKDFLDMLPAKQKGAKARLHKGTRPIFNQYNVEDQIESIYQPQVQLPSGGSIVIDPTEALVAIDVNSGSTGKGKNFEESIFKANMEAATELARQLRLRDLGGLIVVDFIDMRVSRNIREVERQVKNAMKRDRAKVDISRISKFGLMQISRQKLGAPIETSNYRVCEHCKGRGIVRSVETLALFYLRRIQTGGSRKEVVKVECHFPLDVAQYLLNNKRNEISDMESRNKIDIIIVADPTLKPADHEIICHKQEKAN